MTCRIDQIGVVHDAIHCQVRGYYSDLVEREITDSF